MPNIQHTAITFFCFFRNFKYKSSTIYRTFLANLKILNVLFTALVAMDLANISINVWACFMEDRTSLQRLI